VVAGAIRRITHEAFEIDVDVGHLAGADAWH
jgi:hypothetical protein